MGRIEAVEQAMTTVEAIFTEMAGGGATEPGAVFNQPGGAALSGAFSRFFNALQDLANNPESDATRAAVREEAVYMTVQTLWGFAGMYVYETGREMMDLGVVPLANMLPEVAFIKLSWALGQSDDADDVKRFMLTPINDEITEREPYNGYLLYQGAVPEVQVFLKSIKR